MLFSSISFLYYFLPLVLCFYFITPFKGKNYVLLIASIIFYAWGEPRYILLILSSIVVAWGFGFVIDKYRSASRSKAAFIGSVAVSIGLLCLFKYADFFLENLNRMMPGGVQLPLLRLVLPIGISFYTFQILSYTIDLYRGSIKLQKNLFDFACYVILFPQLIAGPIVRYSDVEKELKCRSHTMQQFSEGAFRFIIGLSKKVLLANVIGELGQFYKEGLENSVLFAWLYGISFTLQIYFDFSGYSDMAIGLGKIFGFHFPENFNYPYISKSVTEFWRRWHMTLGSWFRDYVYIPMGGNRKGMLKHIFNIVFVWFLTGFWHGAGWNFIFWGLYFALWLLIEKYVFNDGINKVPAFLRHIGILLILMIGWIFFDADSIALAVRRIGYFVGIGTDCIVGKWSIYYLKSYLVPILIAIFAATPYPKRLIEYLQFSSKGRVTVAVARPLGIFLLLSVITAYLIDGSFNPFIYFRF